MQAGGWWKVVVAVGCVVGCGDGMERDVEMPPPTDAPMEPAQLTRRDAEPAGPHCAYGGVAVHSGGDRDADGALDDDEIEATVYECNPATTTLIRHDIIGRSATCPGGATAVQTGIDDNNNGVLEDPEIDTTDTQCNSLEHWTGDFTAADWADPVKVTALGGARILDGSLTITARFPNVTGDIELPLLEVVHGNVKVGDLLGLSLPSLREIDGDVTIQSSASTRLAFAVLDRVGGTVSVIEETLSGDASIDAPALREIGGGLTFGARVRATVSMPKLTSVASLIEDGALAELHLDALAVIAHDLDVSDNRLTTLSLRGLTSVGGEVSVTGQALTSVDLSGLQRVGGDLAASVVIELPALAMPALTSVGGGISINGSSSLVALDLHNLEVVGGGFRVAELPMLSVMQTAKLRTIGSADVRGNVSVLATGLEDLDLGSLAEITGVALISSNLKLRAVQLPVLHAAARIAIQGSPALEVVAAPVWASVGSFALADLPSLRTLDAGSVVQLGSLTLRRLSLPDLSGLRALTRVLMLSVDGVEQLRDLRGLSSIQQVAMLELSGNPALSSLDGLEAVSAISGHAAISGNPVLASVAGLRNVAAFGAGLEISGNTVLPGIELTGLTAITGDLTLTSNPALTSLSGLAALSSVTGALVVTSNDALPATEVEELQRRLGK